MNNYGKYRKIEKEIAQKAEAFLIESPLNVFYASGIKYEDGYFLVTPEKSYALCDFRYIEDVSSKAFGFEVVELKKNSFRELIDGLGIKSIMFEENYVTVSKLSMLKNKFPSIDFIKSNGLIESLREKKDSDEIEKIKKSQSITDAAFKHILGLIDDKITECELALELEYFMKKSGASGIAFETICISGTASSMPHGKPRNKKLEKGFLTMDFGAEYCGYDSDMTRTVSIGKATDEMKCVYSTVLSAQRAALEIISCKMDCAYVDGVARDIINKTYNGTFGHSLGHGVGIYIHEGPNLSPVAKGKALSCGNVVTVEPGIYLSGKFGVRIEDMVVIGSDKCENLTKSPKELIEL